MLNYSVAELRFIKIKNRNRKQYRFAKDICPLNKGKAFTDNPITQRFYRLANKELMSPSLKEWQEMKDFIYDEVPELKTIAHKHSLKDIEYEICILVLLGFSPSEMVILTERSKSDISNIRHRLYQKITGENGSSKDFDTFIRGLL
ncbi:MAG: hypothetical protein Q4D41_08505 [Prevotellaceae bacterium]|nr:hypothetical protein [Prevotellaceae bacterium]